VRINVIGTSGSGKTTFGRQLADAINHPFYEMDALFWGPDWYFPTNEEFFPRVKKVLAGENWVLDGNYSRTMGFKWERVQAVIWLNYSFPRTVYQAVKRALTRLVDQKELWPGTGNRENVKMLFSRESIVLWTISSYHRQAKRNAGYLDDERFPHIVFHRIRSPRQAKIFLEKVQEEPTSILEPLFRSSRK
jgi:adenylate kinase family enzyme